MSEASGHAWTKVEVSHVIVRGCVTCGHSREQGVPCAGCGNPEPPVVHDLGVQSFTHRSLLRRLAWRWCGQFLAARRARAAAKYVTGKGA